jgi:hypothetical protein
MTDLLPTDADVACLGAAARTCAVAEQIAVLVRPLEAQATTICSQLAADDRSVAAAEPDRIAATQLMIELRSLEELTYRLGEAGLALQRVLEAPAAGEPPCPKG